MIEATDARLSFVPIEKATKPQSGMHMIYCDYWWIVHPKKGLIFYGKHAPQCNFSKEAIEGVRLRLYPWAEVKMVPVVFVKVNQFDC